MKKGYDKSTAQGLFRNVVLQRLDRIDRVLEWLVKMRVNDDILEIWRNPAYNKNGERLPIQEQWHKLPYIKDILEKSGK